MQIFNFIYREQKDSLRRNLQSSLEKREPNLHPLLLSFIFLIRKRLDIKELMKQNK